MEANELITKVESYVKDLFNTNPTVLSYHNLEHTKSVVAATIQIAEHYKLKGSDLEALLISAWFHDIGYLYGVTKGHEEKGLELAGIFLAKENAGPELIEKVSECILATRMPQQPVSLLGKIICDADLFHLGTDDFSETNKKVRKEFESYIGNKIPAEQWISTGLELLRRHEFQTDYCKVLLKEKKQKNIEKLEQKLKEKLEQKPKEDQDDMSEKKEKDKSSEYRAGKGIETMFRTTSTNHLKLSEMADSKANILLTVNSLMVSVLISVLFRHLSIDSEYLFPAILFLLTALASVVCAILVTIPNINSGVFTRDDIKSKKANLLFFGNFYKMKLEDYQWGIEQMMKDPEFLYGTMSKDIYHLGVVLGRKYKLLRLAYRIFMVGFIISVLSFIVMGYLYSSNK